MGLIDKIRQYNDIFCKRLSKIQRKLRWKGIIVFRCSNRDIITI
jgi:hypothetical protein